MADLDSSYEMAEMAIAQHAAAHGSAGVDELIEPMLDIPPEEVAQVVRRWLTDESS
jgi:flagellar biosynthesis/type III secretory pathway M-ring protein FliF/YscJ